MKHVQIRSFVMGGNHGQYLQALGLRYMLKSLLPTARVTHLDYENHFSGELKVQVRGGMLPKFLAMRSFWRRNFEFSGLDTSVDASVYGSDMIWHMGSDLFPTDDVFFGRDDQAPLQISYAPSVGARVSNEPESVVEGLRTFHAFGVRDDNTKNLVEEHLERVAEHVIDPCFFLIESPYFDLDAKQVRHNVVTCYSADSTRLTAVLDAKSQEHLHSDVLGYWPRMKFFRHLRAQFTDPLWTLERIRDSQFLLTSTFHGVMMALMAQTPFVCMSSPNLLARLESPIAEVFSPQRVMSIEEFENLGQEELAELRSFDDFDAKALITYLKTSRDWLNSALQDLVS